MESNELKKNRANVADNYSIHNLYRSELRSMNSYLKLCVSSSSTVYIQSIIDR